MCTFSLAGFRPDLCSQDYSGYSGMDRAQLQPDAQVNLAEVSKDLLSYKSDTACVQFLHNPLPLINMNPPKPLRLTTPICGIR